MATTVCVNGDVFDVDGDGKLILKIDGAPAEHAWPSDGTSPEDCNPLRIDPDGGLWVPPPADSTLVAGSAEDGGSQSFNDSDGGTLVTHTLLNHTDTVHNPSSCLGAIAFCQVAVDFRYSWSSGGGADSQLELTLEWDNGDGSGFGAADSIYNDRIGLRDMLETLTAYAQGNRELELEYTRFVTGLDPNEVRNVKARVVAQGSDDIEVSKCIIQVRSIVVTQA